MDDCAIHITRWGLTGPRVVLIHGSAQGGQSGGERHFAAQERLAQRGWQIIVPDRPGHGRSPPPGRPDDARLDGAWVADLLGDSAHLVGHSFGACVALAAAARRTEAVRSLTLIEPGMQGLALDDSHVRRYVLRLILATRLSLGAANRARRFMNIVGIPAALRETRDAAELKRLGQGIGRIRIPSKATLAQQLDQIRNARIPLLTVSGGWSAAMDVTAARVATIGGGQYRRVPSPHHFPQLVSDEFNELLAHFMTTADEPH